MHIITVYERLKQTIQSEEMKQEVKLQTTSKKQNKKMQKKNKKPTISIISTVYS